MGVLVFVGEMLVIRFDKSTLLELRKDCVFVFKRIDPVPAFERHDGESDSEDANSEPEPFLTSVLSGIGTLGTKGVVELPFRQIDDVLIPQGPVPFPKVDDSVLEELLRWISGVVEDRFVYGRDCNYISDCCHELRSKLTVAVVVWNAICP